MPKGEFEMTETFQVGDQVSWIRRLAAYPGKIIKVHTGDFDHRGHTHRASEDDPQYKIKSDKSDHIAAHKAARSIARAGREQDGRRDVGGSAP
jgi:hypothetical protein